MFQGSGAHHAPRFGDDGDDPVVDDRNREGLMGFYRIRILGVVLLAVLVPLDGLVHAQSKDPQASGAKRKMSAEAPGLADIIPLASKLSGRLDALENRITGLVDVSAVEKRYAEIEADVQKPADQIARVMETGVYIHRNLVDLKEEIRRQNQLLEEAGKPLRDAIAQLGTWRKEWMAEKEQWKTWQSSLLVDGKPDRLRWTFQEANHTIDRALRLIVQRLEAMLTVQEKAAKVDAGIVSHVATIDNILLDWRRGIGVTASPPMFSFQYFSQFVGKNNRSLVDAVRGGMDEISWPDRRLFSQQGWTMLIPGFLSACLIIAFYRNRRVLRESIRWHFIAARPLSAGLFFGGLTVLLMYAYEGMPLIWKLATFIIVGIFSVRLAGGMIDVSWGKQFVHGVLTLILVTGILIVINLPLPLFRLYTVLAALVGLLFCMRWAKESSRKKYFIYPWLLRSFSVFFGVIIVLQLLGKNTLAWYLFYSFIVSMAASLLFLFLRYMIHGGLEWLFRASPLRRAAAFHGDDTDAIIRRVARFTDVALLGLVVLPANLMIWGVYDNLQEAMDGVLALGFNLGSQRISVRLMIVSAGILYGSYIASWIFQKWITDEALESHRLERGVRHSIARLVHDVMIFVGFLFALFVLGFRITELTIMLSALGVGIGFGLQAIVNNFVSGLILLFERPVRVDDTIELGGQWAVIKKIGLRATTVQTFDQADLIVPNADLVTNQVTNWTLTNRQVRLTIPVGVAYGSDVSRVMDTLKACADTNSKVVKTPKPQVLFLGFGESSLDFELRVFVRDADDRIQVKSELHQEIDRRFREANIEIAFPQRDLHIRSIDDSIHLRPPETDR
jgi:potassium efflux system protein